MPKHISVSKPGMATRPVLQKAHALFYLLFFSLFVSSQLQAAGPANKPFFQSPSSSVTGIVKNQDGAPVANATVQVKNKNGGVTTNEAGKFTIDAAKNDILVISSVGFTPLEIRASNVSGLNGITLEKTASELDQVVVVGYGTQKKANLSGSVSSVSGKVLSQRPTPNFQNLLQGRIAGLDVIQSTGEPGRDNASFRLRGVGTNGVGASNAPLVLVDGILGTINNLSPEDIENVTVLKDAASASIYGARAANGVILITTKKGKAGRNMIEYTGNWSTSEATKHPELITNSVKYMEMYNQARARSGQAAQYTQAQIDLYKNNPNSTQYPNFNWIDYVLGKGPMQSHNLSFSGGAARTTYNISLNYLDQKSITKGYIYKRYNALLDFATQAHDRIKVGANINFSFQDAKAPWLVNDDLLLLAYASAPTFMPFLPDGSGRATNRDFGTNGAGNRSVEEVYNTGGQFTKNYNVNAQGFAEVDIIKGLKWNTKAAITFFNQDYRNRQFPSPSYSYQPDAAGVYQVAANGNPTFSGLQQSSARNITKTIFSTLNYNRSFGTSHNVSALAGYEQQDNRSTSLAGNRFDFPNSTIMELNGSTGLNQTTGGTASEWALRSFFGRANYDYKGKYFLEGDIRYDGTSRVDPRYRYGTYGGGSAAWKISEEGFMKKNAPWINNLKLRGSYGVLGNQEIANYPYQDILAITSYPFSALNLGAQLTRLTAKDLRWENTAIIDFGLDVDMFNGLFGATIDWYKKDITDILTARTDVPASVGLAAPTVNAGAIQNTGIEIELRHQNHIGEFTYGASVLFHKYKNKVTKALVETLGTFEIGQPLGNLFIYQWDGVFQSTDEIAKAAKQPSSGVLKPGDLKIADISGNGTVGPEDRIRVRTLPNYTYSFNLNAGWKGFNISAFFQGVQGVNTQVTGWGYEPFMQGSAPPLKYLDVQTTATSHSSSTIPAVYLTGYIGVAGYSSTYFIQDASYLRLKNLYVSYTFPQNIVKKIFSQGLMVYVSGDNLVTWTKYEGNDPERAGNGRFAQFPQLRILTAGAKIKF